MVEGEFSEKLEELMEGSRLFEKLPEVIDLLNGEEEGSRLEKRS